MFTNSEKNELYTSEKDTGKDTCILLVTYISSKADTCQNVSLNVICVSDI